MHRSERYGFDAPERIKGEDLRVDGRPLRNRRSPCANGAAPRSGDHDLTQARDWLRALRNQTSRPIHIPSDSRRRAALITKRLVLKDRTAAELADDLEHLLVLAAAQSVLRPDRRRDCMDGRIGRIVRSLPLQPDQL